MVASPPMHRGIGWVAMARGPIAYMRITGPLTRDAVDATRRVQLEALAVRPSGMAFLLDASGDVSLPPADVRDYAAEMAAKHPAGMLVHVTLMPGDGFRKSALRGALTGIFVLARSPYPRFVVADVDEAHERIRRALGEDAPLRSEVSAALDQLRDMAE